MSRVTFIPWIPVPNIHETSTMEPPAKETEIVLTPDNFDEFVRLLDDFPAPNNALRGLLQGHETH
jgi:hypothetical protein